MFFGFLRPWYLLTIILFGLVYSQKSLLLRELPWFLFAAYLMFIALIFGGVFDYVKYSFYLLFVLVLAKLHKMHIWKMTDINDILFIPIAFSMCQLIIFKLIGLDSYLWDIGRPSAFFSESTWFAAYTLVVLYATIHMFQHGQLSVSMCATLLVPTVFFLLEAQSINSIIGLTILMGGVYLQFKKARIAIVCIGVPILFVALEHLLPRLINLSNDPSLAGRLMGFQLLWDAAKVSSFWGEGFNFDYKEDVITSGAALGAKAFSLIFQVYWISGYPGIIFLLFMIFAIVLKDIANKKFLASSALIVFLVMSMFAPLAQGIVGVFLLLIRIVMLQEDNFKIAKKP